MRFMKGYRRLLVPLFGFALPMLGGCIEYRIETTLNADGSGIRHEEMIVDENEDAEVNVSHADFGELMFVTERYRWTHREEVQDDDSTHVFRRETRVRDLASWADVSDDVHIAGAAGAEAGSTVGRISLGDVHFRNTVKVETGRVAEYTSFTYRESFYWENVIDVLVEYFVQSFVHTLDAEYPDLTAEQRGELVGLVRGGLFSAMDQGLLDADDADEEEELMSSFIDLTTAQAIRIVRQRYPDAGEESFSNTLRQLIDDVDGLDEFMQRLPGLQLAFNSEIVFRLNMPGQVTASNAHDRDGATLIWKFGPGDATSEPVEIFAESQVRN
jgi:hypothetical protein